MKLDLDKAAQMKLSEIHAAALDEFKDDPETLAFFKAAYAEITQRFATQVEELRHERDRRADADL